MKNCVVFILSIYSASCFPQDSSLYTNDLPKLNKPRFWIATSASAALWTSSYIALSQAWYKDHDRTSFHFFNDNREWQQVDKIGHIWSSYQMSRLSTEMWRWTGMKKKTATLVGGASGVAYLSIMEIQDAYSSKWGFSWGDMLANMAGAAAFVSQQLHWDDQRIQIKMSYSPYDYAKPLSARRDQLFGNSLAEKILKDYNSQSYWLSVNISSFTKGSFPKWLNLAFGYHAEGMLGGFENFWTDKNGVFFDRSDITRTRALLISPDIDWTKIRSGKKAVKSLLFILNMVKIPAPALELKQGKVRARGIYF